MMDKSRESETKALQVSKIGTTTKEIEDFIRSNRQLLPALFSLSIQPNVELCRVELKDHRKFGISSRLEINHKRSAQIFFFLYSFLHLRKAINLDFLYSGEAMTGPEVKPVRQMKTRDCLRAH